MGKVAYCFGLLDEDDACKVNKDALNCLTFMVYRKGDALWKVEDDTRNKEPKFQKMNNW